MIAPGATTNDDAVLVQRAQDGDFAAFEELVRRHQAKIYALCLGLLKNAAEAEEVTQETFLSAYEKLKGFRLESAFSSWLYRVATNHSLMRLRKKKPEARGGLAEIDDTGVRELRFSARAPREPDDALADRELQARIDAALEALPDDMRAVLLLRAFEGLSNQEIADLVGDTVPAVKSRLHRARLFVREAVADLIGDPL